MCVVLTQAPSHIHFREEIHFAINHTHTHTHTQLAAQKAGSEAHGPLCDGRVKTIPAFALLSSFAIITAFLCD